MTIIEGCPIAGLVPHVTQAFAPYAQRFLDLARIDQLHVYGETTPELCAILDDFGAISMTSFAGFTR